MIAAIRRDYGPPDRITVEHLTVPVPKATEVLLRVHATTVNRTDCANLTARPIFMRAVLGLRRPRKIVLGTDFAGEVVAVGEAVTSLREGDRVFGFSDTGSESQAGLITVAEQKAFPIPKGIPYSLAAASIEGGHYAYSMLRRAGLEPGQAVLVNGATGAIGLPLLQFVRSFDVRIAATCGTENITLIESLGADTVIDYRRKDFTQLNAKYDIVFDAVGKSTFGRCRSVLTPGGTYMSTELGPYAQNPVYALLSRFTDRRVVFPIPYATDESIPFVSDQLARGAYAPNVDRTFGPSQIAEAYRYVLKGQKTGSVVVDMARGGGE